MFPELRSHTVVAVCRDAYEGEHDEVPRDGDGRAVARRNSGTGKSRSGRNGQPGFHTYRNNDSDGRSADPGAASPLPFLRRAPVHGTSRLRPHRHVWMRMRPVARIEPRRARGNSGHLWRLTCLSGFRVAHPGYEASQTAAKVFRQLKSLCLIIRADALAVE